MRHRDLPDISSPQFSPPTVTNHDGNLFRQPGPGHITASVEPVLHFADGTPVDPRLTVRGDAPEGRIPPYVPAASQGANVWELWPA